MEDGLGNKPARKAFDSCNCLYLDSGGFAPDPHRGSAPGPRWGLPSPRPPVPTLTSEPGYTTASFTEVWQDVTWIADNLQLLRPQLPPKWQPARRLHDGGDAHVYQDVFCRVAYIAKLVDRAVFVGGGEVGRLTPIIGLPSRLKAHLFNQTFRLTRS